MDQIDLIIRGGTVVQPVGELLADVAIANGLIVDIATTITAKAANEIDATGLHLFPGLIDSHVHFNEPGRTDWEGFATGSSALAAGGGTCFFDMPLNASPPTLNGESFDAKRAAAERSSIADFALWGGLTPINLDKLPELAARGVIGFKAFMSNSGIDDFPRADDQTLREGMKIAASLGLLVAVHAEDEEMTAALTAEARRGGQVAVRDYLASRPVAAELNAVDRAIDLAAETGCALHIVHVSSPEAADQITKRKGDADVTFETCPHYLALTDAAAEKLGSVAKCAPPLRSAAQAAALWKQVANALFDFIASDHSPAPESMKTSQDFFEVWGGIAGVQSTLSLLLSGEPKLPPQLVGLLIATNVARRFNLSRKGSIAPGFDADLALVDLSAATTLRREQLLDRHRLSPYVGRTMSATIRRTIVRGRTVFLDGQLLHDHRGRLIQPRKIC